MLVLNGDGTRCLATIADLVEPIAASMAGVLRREAQWRLRQATPLGGAGKFGVISTPSAAFPAIPLSLVS